MTTVRLILRPCSLTAAKHADKFDAWLDGHYIVTSREPLLDGARELLRRGYSPDTLLTTRHDGKDFDNFEPLPLARLARLSTQHDRERRPSLKVQAHKTDKAYRDRETRHLS